MSYVIMPRYGENIENIFIKHQKKMSLNSTVCLGIQLLNILECVHKAGYVYNDLKPDNLMIDFDDKVPDYNNKTNIFENI